VDASKGLRDPSGRSLYEAWRISRAKSLKEDDGTGEVTDFNLAETRIGSGSDYAALLDHAGVPVLDVSFVGPYGVYHSAYDDFYWMDHFGDPGFHYHSLMAQLLGVLALRLSNADLLSYDFGSYGAHIREYLATLAAKSDLSRLNLDSLRRAIDEFERGGKKLTASLQTALASGTLDPLLADQINRGMMSVERNWIIPGGIPGRPWYRHLLYACRQTYAHLELPGLTEAVEGGDLLTAQRQAGLLETALRNNADLVNQLNLQLACASGLSNHGVSVCAPP
jgi:N-acetylated-alpha-linked acidic dipeptidase